MRARNEDAMAGKSSASLARALLALALAVAIPMAGFAMFLFQRYSAAENIRYERQAVLTARQVATVIDAEHQRLAASLRGLAASDNLESGNLAAFHAEAIRFVEGTDETIVLADAQGRSLFSTAAPYPAASSAAGRPDDAWLDDALLGDALLPEFPERTPSISGIRTDRDGEPYVAVGQPVALQGRELVLAAIVPAAHFERLLNALAPPDWVIGLADGEGRYVARVPPVPGIAGRPGLADYLARASGREGTFVSAGLGNRQLLAGYHRSGLSGWLVGANVPLDIVVAPFRRSLRDIAIFGLLSAALALGLAWWTGLRFSRAAGALVGQADDLRHGRPLRELPTAPREFAMIAEAFLDADRALRKRKMELEIVLDNVPAPVWFTYERGVGNVSRNRVAAQLMKREMGDTQTSVSGTPAPGGVSIRRKGHAANTAELPLQRALAGELVADDEYEFAYADGSVRTVLVSALRLHQEPDGVVGAVAVGLDITERKRDEARRRLLINELNHRVKNTLASVQAIVLQTLRSAPSRTAARAAIEQRLQALSRAHDILNAESWQGANLEAVVETALSLQPDPGRLHRQGPAVWLPASTALALTLTLHELATNALKYGAWSGESGKVEVSWSVRPGAESSGTDLVLEWRETGGPQVSAPTRKGFGSRLIASVLAAENGAGAAMDYAPGGFSCSISLPLGPGGRDAIVGA